MIDEVRTRAATIEHEWDARALDWPLTSESVVVEVGGYTGRWALQIAERYQPRLYVFEPQPWAAAVCREVLGTRATVLDYALGTEGNDDQPKVMPMGDWGTDGCSLVKPGHEWVTMHAIETVFAHFGLTHIDLMLMNIEGYEYTLIPHMLGQAIMPRRLMVQLHPPTGVAGDETRQIYERLAALGYRIAWSYGVVLTAWERV